MLQRARLAFAVAVTLFAPLALRAQGPAAVPPSAEQKKLGVFVGTWKDEGEMKAGPFGPGGKISITQSCEWFSGRYSVVCHSETTGVTGDRNSISILSYNVDENFYEFYELKSVGRVALSKCAEDSGTWTCSSESSMGGKVLKVRYTIKLVTPDSAILKTELSFDAEPWTAVMELRGTRAK